MNRNNDVMFYLSDRALNEVHDGRLVSSTGTSNGGIASSGLSVGRSRALTHSPSAAAQVDYALKRARKQKRRIAHDLWEIENVHGIFDVIVHELHVGIMPFMSFGNYGETPHKLGKVRAFWAHATLPPRQADGPEMELVLLGSRSNVADQAWGNETEDELKIGHGYPSSPDDLARVLSWELELDDDESVREAVSGYEQMMGLAPLGASARFAYEQTIRANEMILSDEGFARTWERRYPFTKARVVGSMTDIVRSADDQNVVLARPIFIQDLS